ncbi:MAG TPA: DUF898 family protein [Xanthobacteraceae bacterium]|nr:DUF898 family protein [Xanthobacteraceae bacterium]
MNLREAVASATAYPAPTLGKVRFLGKDAPYWRLLIRGALLLICTLGIYRFWLTTDIRRFLWGNTEIAGDHLEYTGTALELLVGFLIAIAILLPINILFFLAALDLGLIGKLSGVIAFTLLALLGQFAIYRARRYRLSRTVYRGVRFYQTGSAWAYAFYAVMWWALTALTFGLAYPWAQKSLERFKMRRTYYGDLPGYFEGSALALFLRGLPLWLLVIGPLLGGVAAAAHAIDWPALAEAVNEGGSGLGARVEATNPGFGRAIIFFIGAAVWSTLAAAVFYPAFQAMMLRWWTAGLRFGDVTVTSHLRTGQIYRAYFRFLLYGILFAIGFSLVAFAALGAVEALTAKFSSAEAEELIFISAAVVGYMIIALGYSTIYQATVKLTLWRRGMEAAEISGIASLDRVKAAGRPTSALGEGLADALHLGGI